MKSGQMNQFQQQPVVVPHEGTWIEIENPNDLDIAPNVVPHEGTWIEMLFVNVKMRIPSSFPTRERGLKSKHVSEEDKLNTVVPHEGTWIEI